MRTPKARNHEQTKCQSPQGLPDPMDEGGRVTRLITTQLRDPDC
jgi:hypothetical protein